MDLHSIISYHPHPHRSLHKFLYIFFLNNNNFKKGFKGGGGGGGGNLNDTGLELHPGILLFVILPF